MSNLIPQCLGLLVWGSPELATWLGNGTLYFHQSNAQSCFQGCCLMQWRWEERWGMSQEKMCFGDKLHRLAQSDSQSWERPVSAGLRWSEVTCPRYLGSEGQVWSSLASQWRLFTAKALFLQDLAEILLFRCLQPLWSCCSSSALGETLHFINTYERLWAWWNLHSLPCSIISNVKCQKWALDNSACIVWSREEFLSGLQQRKMRSMAQHGVRAFVAGNVHN